MRAVYSLFLLLTIFLAPGSALASKCLYVSSYHQGYEWNDGVQRGIEKVLQKKCELKTFYLDSKRNPGNEWIRWRSREALKLIKSYNPDVIIASDDNASRYLVEPYLRKGKIPVVFCGLNWSMSEYGYPYPNATGMIEVAPVKPLIKQLKLLAPQARKGVFISSDVITEHKDYQYYKRIFREHGITLKPIFVKSFRSWVAAFKKAQSYDFLFVGNNAGINDWYGPEAERTVAKYSRKFSMTTYKWMLPYAAIAYTKIPEEQGEWAAKVALKVLDGMKPGSIPVVYNRQWDIWINNAIMQKLRIKIPYMLLNRAKHYK